MSAKTDGREMLLLAVVARARALIEEVRSCEHLDFGSGEEQIEVGELRWKVEIKYWSANETVRLTLHRLSDPVADGLEIPPQIAALFGMTGQQHSDCVDYLLPADWLPSIERPPA